MKNTRDNRGIVKKHFCNNMMLPFFGIQYNKGIYSGLQHNELNILR